MAFSEASKTCALEFLEKFISGDSAPGQGDPLPVRPAWPQLTQEELEAECLEMARRYLATKSCPGLLSYHIAAESYRRISSAPLDHLKAPPPPPSEEEETEENTTPSPPMLESISLAKYLLETVHQVCKDWCKDFPVLSAPVDKVELSMYGIKNTRRKMEDRYAICLDLNSLYGFTDMPPQAYYAVFDGHVGVEAAVYSSVHVLTNVVRHRLFQQDLPTAIKEGIKKTDEHFCKKGARSGATAVVAFIRGDKVCVGWLGDSQALLVRGGGNPLQLVNPHKPGREDEQQRIEDAGGLVVWMGAWRVNGNLSVSRAIGDAKEKKFVVSDADVESVDLDGSEEYLVVACDGVWDVLNGEEVVECVKNHLASPSGSKQTVARALVEFAKSEGSGDNMTCIVVFFKGFTGTPEPKEGSCDAPKVGEGPPGN